MVQNGGSRFPQQRCIAVMLMLAAAVEGGDKPAELQVKKSVLAHVKCQVCEMLVAQARDYSDTLTPRNEDTIGDMLDDVCSVKKKPGRWLTKIDITQNAEGNLVLEKKDVPLGKCQKECTTNHRACVSLLNGREEDLREMLLDRLDSSTMQTKFCKKMCMSKKPPLEDWEDEEFVALTEEDDRELDFLEMGEELTGMKQQMFSGEELKAMSPGEREDFWAIQRAAQHEHDVKWESKKEKEL